MDKHKNADRHKIYPGFRKFYDKGLLKATYKDIALKKEYQCSKCGKKIKIDNYEKMRKRSRLIQRQYLYVLYRRTPKYAPKRYQ